MDARRPETLPCADAKGPCSCQRPNLVALDALFRISTATSGAPDAAGGYRRRSISAGEMAPALPRRGKRISKKRSRNVIDQYRTTSPSQVRHLLGSRGARETQRTLSQAQLACLRSIPPEQIADLGRSSSRTNAAIPPATRSPLTGAPRSLSRRYRKPTLCHLRPSTLSGT
jgi:hypothetical protein